MDRPSHVDTIEQVRELPGGGRELRVRGRLGGKDGAPIPLVCRFGGGASIRRGRTSETDVVWEDRAGEPAPILIRRADGTWQQLADDEELPTTGIVRIRGIASSTGVDSYGTEMTRGCLDYMAAQFRRPGVTANKRGVAYAPTHWEREWDEVVGRSVDALVLPVSEVLNAADPTEDAYVLQVDIDVDLGKRNRAGQPRGRQLVQAIRAGEELGQSIGGWFLDISILESADGTERWLVHKVELDHLAATRTPANGDSNAITIARGLVASELQARGLAPSVVASEPFATAWATTEPPGGTAAPEQRAVSQMLRRVDRSAWLRTYGGLESVPGRVPVENPVGYAGALRERRIQVIGVDTAGHARLADLYEGGFSARHVVAFEELDNAWAVSWLKADTFEDGEEMGSALSADELSVLEGVDHRHVVTVEDEDDRITVWFLKEMPDDEMEDLSQDETENRGESLGSFLNEQIDGMVDDDTTRTDILERMAAAAGISVSTVNQILRGEINCPPIDRLEGFAEVLPASLNQILDAAEADGCSYERSACCDPCAAGTGPCEGDSATEEGVALASAPESDASDTTDAAEASSTEEGDMPISDEDAAKLAGALLSVLREAGVLPGTAAAAAPATEDTLPAQREEAPAPPPAPTEELSREQLLALLGRRDREIDALLQRPQQRTGTEGMFRDMASAPDGMPMWALSEGERIDALATRAQGGQHNLLARVVKGDRNLRHLLNAMQPGNEAMRVTKHHLQGALTNAIRAYRAGGGLSKFFPSERSSAPKWR